MSEVIVDKLYERLQQKDFQDTLHGDLFYNYFIVPYDPTKEYETRERIKWYCDNLIRPLNYVNVLHLDIFDEFCRFLDGKPFGKKYPSYLQYLLEKEKTNKTASEGVARSLSQQAQGDEFIAYIHNRIREHKEAETENKTPYVFLSGFGNIYPYLRLSTFLNKYEEHNQTHAYKLIVFYPGEPEGNSFKLFDRFDDQHVYRAALILDFRNSQ
jgi:hypothetical protein